MPLLKDPNAPWVHPALTTFRKDNHSFRSEKWRYIRYADGGEELYDHDNDPYEWTNLASDPALAEIKSGLALYTPVVNAAELPSVKSGNRGKNKNAAKTRGKGKRKK